MLYLNLLHKITLHFLTTENTYTYMFIYIYIVCKKQIIEAYFYAMFYILLNSCGDDYYVLSDRQMRQGSQQTWT
jgi:hypothetical protein